MPSVLSKLTQTVKDTFIIIVLDRSGSMVAIRDATIKGFNEFLKEQKAIKGKADLKLVQFDDQYEVVYDFTDIQQIKDLDDKTFIPRNTTALYDAIGQTIVDTESYVSNFPQSQVLFVIITDGLENASVNYKQKKVFEMISDKRKNDKWEFAFIGANQDSFVTSGNIGVGRHATLNYQATNIGTQAMYKGFSSAVSAYRATSQYKYKDPEDLKDDEDNETK